MCCLSVVSTFSLFYDNNLKLRTFTLSDSQSHRASTVMGLLGVLRRSFRGAMVVLRLLRSASSCSLFCTAFSSAWWETERERYLRNTHLMVDCNKSSSILNILLELRLNHKCISNNSLMHFVCLECPKQYPNRLHNVSISVF